MPANSKPKSKKLYSQTELQDYARQNYAELLPITEMGRRGYFGCLSPRGMVGIDSFIFSIHHQGKIAKVQSKYTKNSSTTSIPLETVLFDFLVVYRDGDPTAKTKPPTTYVIPKKAILKNKAWSGQILTLSSFENYIVPDPDSATADPWQAIADFLN